ncbi:MAG: serine acetyltransferase [Spirochaetes bacterium]|nr:serine acetyltransferase [Spirochaetota bacterium]
MKSKYNKEIIWTQNIENKISSIVSNIIKSYEKKDSIAHIHKYPIPSKDAIINILKDLFDILYPGYFTDKELNKTNIHYYIGNKTVNVLEKLSEEIAKSFRHEHIIKNNICELCDESIKNGTDIALFLLENIPEIRKKLSLDVKAAYDGDPAAKCFNEIVFSYPGLFAITVHRIAHILYEKNTPLIPRIMSEYSHSLTGIDIHPGANIGEYFFTDHGTGIVIGETCIIGKNVKIYQGVTLGALSFPKDEKGKLLKGLQRHPIIEDNVTIYSGATILGGKTVIGKNSIIGGNVWLVSSIPPNSKVTLAGKENKIIIG